MKNIKVSLGIEANVSLDSKLKEKIEKEYGKNLTDIEAAEYLLYAFLNPKIHSINENEVEGIWDNVCQFNGKINDFELVNF
ncbi:hypothetical protein [Bacillus sp. ISL-7]|uniref:hypothetical protein n=1 Tax=Bacillus sp. ISL-7 TaxID=2819136 RepID=UPI001BEAE317|nr:hypothetical protein [Bacillus sp. ISL-7]MBT2734598.1 hypothetical protein [Bacillus sp. ISL-7]